MASEALRQAERKVTVAALECELIKAEHALSQLRSQVSQANKDDTEASSDLIQKIQLKSKEIADTKEQLQAYSPRIYAQQFQQPGQGTSGLPQFQQPGQGGLGLSQLQQLSLETPFGPRGGKFRDTKRGLSPIHSESRDRESRRNIDSSEDERGSDSRPSRTRTTKPRKYRKGDDICLFLDRFLDFTTNNKIRDDRMDLQLVELIDDERMYRKLKKISDKLTREESRRPELLIRAVKRLLFKEDGDLANTADLRNLVQGPSEQVEDFSFRITDAVTKIGVNDHEGEMLQSTTFIQGLRPEIRDRMGSKAKKYKFDFQGLVDLAEKYEMQLTRPQKTTSTTEPVYGEIYATHSDPVASEISQISNTCSECGKPGHKAETCWAKIVCQLCGKRGHVASACSQLKNYSEAAVNVQPSSIPNYNGPAVNVQRSSGPSRRYGECFNCGEEGHFANSCRNRRRNPTRDSGYQSSSGGYAGPSRERQWEEQQQHLNGQGNGRRSIQPFRQNRYRN